MSPVTLLDYPLDRERLLASAVRARASAQSYQDWRSNTPMDFWKIAQYNDEYIDQIQNDLGVTGKPRFYWAAANSIIPTHIDYNTKCAVNFVLSENLAPVTFRGKDYHYTQAVLNTSQPHSVVNGPEERVLFKISVFEESYEELVARIPFRKTV